MLGAFGDDSGRARSGGVGGGAAVGAPPRSGAGGAPPSSAEGRLDGQNESFSGGPFAGGTPMEGCDDGRKPRLLRELLPIHLLDLHTLVARGGGGGGYRRSASSSSSDSSDYSTDAASGQAATHHTSRLRSASSPRRHARRRANEEAARDGAAALTIANGATATTDPSDASAPAEGFEGTAYGCDDAVLRSYACLSVARCMQECERAIAEQLEIIRTLAEEGALAAAGSARAAVLGEARRTLAAHHQQHHQYVSMAHRQPQQQPFAAPHPQHPQHGYEQQPHPHTSQQQQAPRSASAAAGGSYEAPRWAPEEPSPIAQRPHGSGAAYYDNNASVGGSALDVSTTASAVGGAGAGATTAVGGGNGATAIYSAATQSARPSIVRQETPPPPLAAHNSATSAVGRAWEQLAALSRDADAFASADGGSAPTAAAAAAASGAEERTSAPPSPPPPPPTGSYLTQIPRPMHAGGGRVFTPPLGTPMQQSSVAVHHEQQQQLVFVHVEQQQQQYATAGERTASPAEAAAAAVPHTPLPPPRTVDEATPLSHQQPQVYPISNNVGAVQSPFEDVGGGGGFAVLGGPSDASVSRSVSAASNAHTHTSVRYDPHVGPSSHLYAGGAKIIGGEGNQYETPARPLQPPATEGYQQQQQQQRRHSSSYVYGQVADGAVHVLPSNHASPSSLATHGEAHRYAQAINPALRTSSPSSASYAYGTAIAQQTPPSSMVTSGRARTYMAHLERVLATASAEGAADADSVLF